MTSSATQASVGGNSASFLLDQAPQARRYCNGVKAFTTAGMLWVVTLLFVALPGCELFAPTDAPLEIIVKGNRLSLSWDPPIETLASGVAAYRLYARPHGADTWELVGKVEASDNPGATIASEDLGYGFWEFAVSSVSSEDVESELHASIDRSADPPTGWYVNWVGSK